MLIPTNKIKGGTHFSAGIFARPKIVPTPLANVTHFGILNA